MAETLTRRADHQSSPTLHEPNPRTRRATPPDQRPATDTRTLSAESKPAASKSKASAVRTFKLRAADVTTPTDQCSAAKFCGNEPLQRQWRSLARRRARAGERHVPRASRTVGPAAGFHRIQANAAPGLLLGSLTAESAPTVVPYRRHDTASFLAVARAFPRHSS